MEYVPLGRSGLVSSVIGLGGGSSSRFGLVKGGTKADAIRLIRMASEEGITFFDGAGNCGAVDELLGEALAARRNDVLLSTKVHLGPEPLLFSRTQLANKASSWIARRARIVCSARTLRQRIEQALTTLRTDRIDVLQLHAVAPGQYASAVAKLVPEVLRMKQEGKLRAIGVTEGFLTDPNHTMLSAAVQDRAFDTIMVGFNVRNPSAAKSIIPRARDAGIGAIGMFAMRGLLDWRAEEMRRILDDAGISLAELSYRYSRHCGGVSIVLSGTGDRAHLKQNIGAALAPPLPEDLLRRVEALASPLQTDDASTRK